MKNYFTFIFIIIFSVMINYAQTFQVGHRQQTFIDSSRANRNVTTEIYYPSDTAGNNVTISSGQFPVLVFGHGFVMVWSAYDVAWNNIVPNGYILVFPTTETSFSPSHTEFGKDMAFLVGAMKEESLNGSSPFFGAVGTTSAVMGHSMGGGAAFLAVQYDTTITVLATVAAAVTSPSSIAAASTITIPAIVFSGVNDCVAPPVQHQQPMYDSLTSVCKTLVNITGGSHCQFASYNINCYFGEGTCTPQPTITPAVQQTITFDLLLPWLDFYLKNNCNSGMQFQNLISASAGITSQQNCNLVCAGAGIDTEFGTNPLTIYPNPFSNETTFKTDENFKNAALTLLNVYGQPVKQMNNISGPTITLKRDNLPVGIYFVRIEQGNKVIATNKLVITD